MNSKEIREKWLSFFESKGHFIVPSKSLVPQNDPSLLWINSGVATLKDYFAGKKVAPAKRLTNSQKAIRTNDIENVGITARHHTFFEMLGNFSIGDYFKKEAIAFASEFLLDVLKLDKEKLYFTYYYEDLDTKNEWMSNGFSEDHMIPGSKETNFWEVGSGPCGPNTEIFYDRGEKYDNRGLELLKEDIENDRYIEIWNIVFSTYNSNGEGQYTELKQKNIDTGAGLERIVSIMQDAPTNFDTDLFLPIIHEIEKYTEFKYDINNYFTKEPEQMFINSCFKVIADHMRTVTNAIADGAKPSNVGRGYILRRLIRRSVYKAMQLKIYDTFLYKLVGVVKNTLPFEYDVEPIKQIIKDEEITFSRTIENGRNLLENYLKDEIAIFPGDVAFKLFETYGFPVELTAEILAQKNIDIDYDCYEKAKKEHADASRNTKLSGMDKVINSLTILKSKVDKFVGYETTHNVSEILYLLDTEKEITKGNGISYVVLKETPFYATSGGQKHDRGYMKQGNNKILILDVFKDKFGNHIHKVEGNIENDLPVECFVDETIRLGLERNHSGTHLMFCALRTVLGDQIKQLGSDNNEERLTFDMPADTKPTDEEIRRVEKLVREYIAKDAKRDYLNMTTEQAKEMGAIMTLEESEYMNPQNVRIVKFDGITADLCGGTHLSNTAKLENFKITNVDKKAAGIYRIRAISSNTLVNEYLEEEVDKLLVEVEKMLDKNAKLNKDYTYELNIPEDKEQAIDYLNATLEKLREDNKQIQKDLANNFEFDYENIEFLDINGHKLYINQDVDKANIKTVASTLREKHNDILVVLTSSDANSMLVVASKQYNSNAIAQQLFKHLNGRGGGNAILSMGKVASTNDLLDFIQNELTWEN
ncbi:alanine--tRNA ligase [Mycoplasmopsis verecunda]|uniref:Alanine--tRNA ligase n=1 Tax=Mycoplasmopsis verecunda TaxID=171291 RepID=A0A1T4L9Q6_9BACT|nr:alanine--tRNA ligase [Mycoplasmopsis verecunda]WPB54479.1 alanine--tRNA ligase [Mycoplasmopsis verecunda]SJZ51333.1 alanyl-tRNA synthetase [Mycoplasmopsis verecunda]